MSAATSALAEHVLAATEEFRKGEEVIERVTEAGIQVTEVFAMPSVERARSETVDLHFIAVGFTEMAATKQDFVRLTAAACRGHGEYADVSIERLLAGPSYIELGGWLGSQDVALRFLALGQFHVLWDVITPARFGMTGAQADQLAGIGFVMLAPKAGLKETLEAA